MPPKKPAASKAAAGGKSSKAAAGGTKKKKKAGTTKKKAEPPPPPPPLPEDPWLVHKSRHGGKLTAADEWTKLQRGDTGRSLRLSESQLAAVADGGQISCKKLDGLIAALAEVATPAAEASTEAEGARVERLQKLEGGAATEAAPEPEPEPKPELEPEPEPEPEADGPVAVLACCSGDIASFTLSEPLRATLIGLDLTDNSLQKISPAVAEAALPSTVINTLTLPAGGCWLRSLCLRANDLVCLPPLASMPKLLHLDLSYNPQLHKTLCLDEPQVREAFAAVPLRSIMIEGCGLVALPPALSTVGKVSGPGGAPRNVALLHLGYNQIPTKKEMEAALKSFPRLTDLSIAGNPVRSLTAISFRRNLESRFCLSKPAQLDSS